MMAVSRPHRAIYCLPLALLFLLPGCSKPPGTAKDGATANETSATSAPVPDADHQRCFACEGTGIGPCHASGCVKGQVECPGSCLRLTRGIWEHMQVTGHGPNELWQKFPNGPGQTMAWNQNHVGEVVVIQNGRAVNMGKCPKCGGATKMKCPICDGKGQQTCEFCAGTKIVPASWTPDNNPVLDRQPDLIRLKDGRSLLGRIATRIGTKYTIKTREGKLVEVDAADILPKTNAVQRSQVSAAGK